MSTTETFQIPVEAAEAYEARFVPALFAPWAELLVDAVGIVPGQRILDVACGTGAVARAAAKRIGGEGEIVGLDLNEAMLTVARRIRPDLEWRQGDAERLPVPDGSFDMVLCQAALMFFPDVSQALREMARVVTVEGTVAVQVWDRREAQPAYMPFIEVAARHAGPEAIHLLSTYFVRGDLDELISLIRSAGLEATATSTDTTTLHFGSVDELVKTEVQSTPLAERLSDDVIRRIVEDSRDALRSFFTENGELDIPLQGHIVIARKR